MVDSPQSAVVAMLAASLSTAFSDVVVDSIVVERARGAPQVRGSVRERGRLREGRRRRGVEMKEGPGDRCLQVRFSALSSAPLLCSCLQATAGSLQSLCWASAAVGGIVSAYASGSLVEEYGTRCDAQSGCGRGRCALNLFSTTFSQHPSLPSACLPDLPPRSTPPLPPRAVFGVTALFPLIVSASALLVNERPIAHASPAHPASSSTSGSLLERLGAQTRGLWGAVRQRGILLPTLFVFLWQASPSAESALFYFQTNQLGFQPEFLGRVREQTI
jgi:hypothetical protein